MFYSAEIYRNVVVGIVGMKALELREYVKVEHVLNVVVHVNPVNGHQTNNKGVHL